MKKNEYSETQILILLVATLYFLAFVLFYSQKINFRANVRRAS
jgi:hypothetical protein